MQSHSKLAKTTNSERIWKTVQAIPKGKVVSYGQIADLAGLPGRARFVSKALGSAPKKLNLPWHRVIRSNGQIAFPVGSEYAELQIKKLNDEQVAVLKHRVNIKEHAWQPSLSEILTHLEF